MASRTKPERSDTVPECENHKTVARTEAGMNPLLQAAQGYLRQGYVPVPISPGAKAPRLKNWQALRLVEADIPKYFRDAENIGILLGEPSGGLVDIDFDVAQATKFAPQFLPVTALKHGRTGKPGSHWWYCTRPIPKSRRFSDIDGTSLVELRSTGLQTVVPPSTHPCGEAIEWETDGIPTMLDGELLVSRVARLASAVLLSRHWPQPGSRHDAALALAGLLLRHDWGEEEAVAFVSAVAEAAGDEEWRDRAADVRSTSRRLVSDGKTTGGVRLKQLIGDAVVTRFSDWLGLMRLVSRNEPLTVAALHETATTTVDIPIATVLPEAVLSDVEDFFSRFLILPPGLALVLALYALATYCFEAFEQFPYLAVISPVKGCGKTRLTEVFEQVAAKVIRTVGISVAALFRLIQNMKPTLIIDEAESLAGRSERAQELGAILNSGNRKNTVVPRCVGKNHELSMFSIYCPKVVCAIRDVSEPTKDRAIVIVMQKKLGSQHIERFIGRNVTPQGVALRKRIAALISAKRRDIEAVYEKLELDFLPDRDAENWLPLFSVLQVLAAERIPELRALAIQMTGAKAAADQDDSLGLRLLGDLQAVWRDGEAAALTTDLISRLEVIDDAPWREAFKLDARKLARLLRGFDVSPRQVRIGSVTGKGYRAEELSVAVSRYVVCPKHWKQPATDAAETQFSVRKQAPSVSDEKSEESPLLMGVVSHVSPGQAKVGQRVRGEL
jgi:hypothetical protein